MQSDNKSEQEEGSYKKAKMRHDLRTENDAPKKKSKEKKEFFLLKRPGIWWPYHNRRTCSHYKFVSGSWFLAIQINGWVIYHWKYCSWPALCINTTVGANNMAPNNSIDIDTNIISTFETMKISSFILFKDCSVGAWGRNDFGRLVDGTDKETVIKPLPNDLSIQKLGVGPRAKFRVWLFCR